jgi:hypothetical protein
VLTIHVICMRCNYNLSHRQNNSFIYLRLCNFMEIKVKRAVINKTNTSNTGLLSEEMFVLILRLVSRGNFLKVESVLVKNHSQMRLMVWVQLPGPNCLGKQFGFMFYWFLSIMNVLFHPYNRNVAEYINCILQLCVMYIRNVLILWYLIE